MSTIEQVSTTEVHRTKKKKCRGDRKRQRFRKQLYKQGCDTETVKRLEKQKFDHSQQQHVQDIIVEELPSVQDIQIPTQLETVIIVP